MIARERAAQATPAKTVPVVVSVDDLTPVTFRAYR
jgi:hypothetical protein